MLNVLQTFKPPCYSIWNESVGSHRNNSIVFSLLLIGIMTCLGVNNIPDKALSILICSEASVAYY